MSAAATQASALRAWILDPRSVPSAGSAGSAGPCAFGLSSSDRLARALARTGVGRTDLLAPDSRLDDPGETRSVVFRSDYFYDERLVAALLAAADAVLCAPASNDQPGEALAANVAGSQLADAVGFLRSEASGAANAVPPSPPSPLRRVIPTDLVPAYNAQLRKHDPPFVYPARPETVREIENRIFAASYKGITDFITKHVLPAPALAVVRVLAKRGVKPNSVTAVGYLLTGLVIWLFAEGHFAVGLLASWLMTFLDTVDGKLARVTLTSSKLGGALDHGLDLVHPPIWWWAWAVGLGLAGGASGFTGLGADPGLAIAMWIVLGGYLVGRILEGIFLAVFGMEIFSWRPFDSFFRGIIARRNPNLLILSVGLGLGRPDLAYTGVALWTLVSIFVVIARIASALAVKRRGGEIRPWHEEQTA